MIVGRLLAPLRRWKRFRAELDAVRDVAEFLEISPREALDRARVKETPQEDVLWNERDRKDKEAYRDYYARNLHYLERQDWYNRNADMNFLKYVPSSGSMLDYGCGTAYVAFKAARVRGDIELNLADIPEAMTAEYARWRLDKYGISYEWFDIPEEEKIDYGKEFDFIRCSDVLEHTFHPDRVMENFHEYLKPGGALMFDFLRDVSCEKENTTEAQALRERTLAFVEENFEVIEKRGHHYLVRKPERT